MQGTGLAHWAAGAVKANAERQLDSRAVGSTYSLCQELLKSAAALVKQGGLVIYVTCALSELENDGGASLLLERTLRVL